MNETEVKSNDLNPQRKGSSARFAESILINTKKAPTEYASADDRAAYALDAAQMGEWSWDLKTDRLYHSARHDRCFGYEEPRTNWNFSDFINHVHPEDQDKVRVACQKLFSGEAEFKMEFRVLWPDGSIRWLSSRAKAARDGTGSLISVGGVLWDITQRKHAEIQLQVERNRLNEIFMLIPTPICLYMDEDLQLAVANPAYEKLVGKNVTGKRLKDVFSYADQNLFIPLIKEVLATGKPFFAKEIPFSPIGPHGEAQELFIDLGLHAFRESDGNTVGVLAFIYDITQQVKMRQEREEKSALLQHISEASSDLIFAKDKNSRVLFANPAVISAIGKSANEIIGHTDIEFLGEELGSAIRENDERIMNSGRAEMVEEDIPVDGFLKKFVSNKIPFRGVDGEILGLFGVARDVTDFHRAQQELGESVKRLEQEKELREKFVATLSHDLRNPLGVAIMGTQLLGDFADSPEAVDVTARILNNLHRANRMIENLLDANRIRSGEPLQMEMSEINLPQLVEEALQELSSVYGKRFYLETETSEIIGFWNSEALLRVIENLCTNAVKYGKPGSKVTLRLFPSDESVFLSVHNEGNPIPTAELHDLFAPFKRATTSSRSDKGWGLGLTLVKGLVAAHGGSVKVESCASFGTTFTLQFPLDSRNK